MGRAIEALASRSKDLEIAYRADHALPAADLPPRQGPDLSMLKQGEVDGIVDFSSSEGAIGAASSAKRLGVPIASGTTGLDEGATAALRGASGVVPVCWAPNFSIGIPLLVGAVRDLAQTLPAGWQIEIAETHHAGKRDAPSGTALRIADTWREKRGGRLVYGRQGTSGPREEDEIGLHAIRLGDVVGEHRVILGGLGETLEITHRVQDRTAFAAGCLEALRRLTRRGPGWYEWEDLLLRD
jgi:4-hydroxy-tetrahydrodipicolinate reductase